MITSEDLEFYEHTCMALTEHVIKFMHRSGMLNDTLTINKSIKGAGVLGIEIKWKFIGGISC